MPITNGRRDVINVCSQTQLTDLMGKYVARADGGVDFKPGPVLDAIIENRTVTLDGVNLLSPALLLELGNLLSQGGFEVKPNGVPTVYEMGSGFCFLDARTGENLAAAFGVGNLVP